jgi:hypothetical protein
MTHRTPSMMHRNPSVWGLSGPNSNTAKVEKSCPKGGMKTKVLLFL